MRVSKKQFVILLCLLFCNLVFAQHYHSIYVTNYENGSSVYSYNDSINSSKYILEGSVTDYCDKIRVIWSPNSFLDIEKYIISGKSNTKIDDFYLKQYKKGSNQFVYNVSGSFDNLVYGSNYYKFIAYFTDGTVEIYNFEFYVYNGGQAERAKPVIYLYPKKTQKVSVKVSPEGGVTESIPEYNTGWTVNATPEGKITTIDTNEEYPYLFWESKDNGKEIDMSEGFVVETANLQKFFEEKLAILGLNEKEIADFTEYWVPELQGKKYVFITFYDKKRIDEEAPLSISPKPDSVIRVYFDHKKLDKKISVKEQKLSTPKRKGFTVVEWGGKRYK